MLSVETLYEKGLCFPLRCRPIFYVFIDVNVPDAGEGLQPALEELQPIYAAESCGLTSECILEERRTEFRHNYPFVTSHKHGVMRVSSTSCIHVSCGKEEQHGVDTLEYLGSAIISETPHQSPYTLMHYSPIGNGKGPYLFRPCHDRFVFNGAVLRIGTVERHPG